MADLYVVYDPDIGVLIVGSRSCCENFISFRSLSSASMLSYDEYLNVEFLN